MKRKLGLSKIKENRIQTISSYKTNIFFDQVIFTPRIYNDKKRNIIKSDTEDKMNGNLMWAMNSVIM